MEKKEKLVPIPALTGMELRAMEQDIEWVVEQLEKRAYWNTAFRTYNDMNKERLLYYELSSYEKLIEFFRVKKNNKRVEFKNDLHFNSEVLNASREKITKELNEKYPTHRVVKSKVNG